MALNHKDLRLKFYSSYFQGTNNLFVSRRTTTRSLFVDSNCERRKRAREMFCQPFALLLFLATSFDMHSMGSNLRGKVTVGDSATQEITLIRQHLMRAKNLK